VSTRRIIAGSEPARDAKRRLGHRGGRRRGRGPRAPGKVGEVEPPPPDELTAQIETPGVRVPAIPARPFVPPYPNLQPSEQTSRALRTDGSAISQAVNEVMQVVESLKQTLAQMEEVLELVELAERQKLTDEREIELLLRALRQFQSRGEAPEHPERFNRPERQNQTNRTNRPQRPERQAGPERKKPPGPVEQPESPEPND